MTLGRGAQEEVAELAAVEEGAALAFALGGELREGSTGALRQPSCTGLAGRTGMQSCADGAKEVTDIRGTENCRRNREVGQEGCCMEVFRQARELGAEAAIGSESLALVPFRSSGNLKKLLQEGKLVCGSGKRL